jgi:pimeloyl-ACP methyl ester carboxylesterase
LEQQIRFCSSDDGVRIACGTTGEGPPIVKAANWLSHVQFDLDSPVWRHWIEEFSKFHRYVRYDERGCGLSDWKVADFSFDAWVRDLEAVVDSLGLERFVLLGLSQGGPVGIAYAVRHPERVSHLVLYGTYGLGWGTRSSPVQIEEREAQIKLTGIGWGRDNPAYRQIFTSQFIPEATPEQIRWFNELQRISTSPDNAVRFQVEFGRIDVRDILSRVKVPTIVLHAQGDQVVPFEEGLRVASKIPGARFVALEGKNHILLRDEPAWSRFLYEVRKFIGVKDELLTERPSTASLGVTGGPATSVVTQAKEAREAHSLLLGVTVASLSSYRVVGNYMRYDQAARNILKDARQKMVAAFLSPSTKRENYLLWAAPGSGKTYFVEEVAASLNRVAQFRELNLAKLTEPTFRSALGELTDLKEPCLCLIDEVDAKADERWPFEMLLPHFDSTSAGGARHVFVVAGSSGSGLDGMKERIASRSKGADLLSRIPVDNEYSVPGMSVGDRIVVALSQFRLAGQRLGREVREVEKLGLYYIALNRRLTNARHLHELAVRAVERMSPGDDRVKYDNLFNPGDPENKAFWGQSLPDAGDMAGAYLVVHD